MFRRWAVLTLVLFFALCPLLGGSSPLAAQDKKAAQEDDKNGEKEKEKKEKPKFKKYEEVITEKAITKKGVFTTHQVEEKLYYEIPESQLEKEFLWLTQLSKLQTGFGYGGTEVQYRVVRWQRYGEDKILLRNVEYRLRAKEGTPIRIAVDAASVESIIKAALRELAAA